MKKFLSSNWKRIIFSIAGIVILINLIFVIFTPATIIPDYIEYGREYEDDLIDKANDVEVNTEILDNASNRMSNDTGISNNVTKAIIIFAILGCVVLFLQNLIDGNQAAAKKK